MKDKCLAFQQETASPPPQKASVAIYEQIRSKILSGELKPGDKLPPERDLIEMFQRSRPTVREALRMLENKNYVTISRGKGTIVNKLSTDEVERTLSNLVRLSLVSVDNILDIRNVCEPLSISLAAQNRTDQDIRVMKDILSYGEGITSDFERSMENGNRFNGAMARSSHNEMLYLIMRITSKFSNEKMLASAAKMSEEEKTQLAKNILKQHFGLFEAIVQRDSEKAVQRNNEHIQSIANALYHV